MGVAAALVGLLAGCGTTTSNYLSKHVLPVGKDGGLGSFPFEDPVDADGASPARGSDIEQHIGLLLDAAEAYRGPDGDADPDAPIPLMIHLHGGRKTGAASARTSDDILKAMRCDPDRAASDPWWYPIFIHWPSGDVGTAGSRLARLRQGRDVPGWAGAFTLPFVLVHDLARGLVRLPLSLPSQLFRDASVASHVSFGVTPMRTWRDTSAIVAAMHAEPGAPDAFRLSDPRYKRSFLAHATRLLLYFPSQILKIPVQATFLEGLGQGAWDEMRRRAHNLVWPTKTFEAKRGNLPPAEVRASMDVEYPTGALPQLFRAIGERERTFELMLVAHSMGAIAMNNALPALSAVIESSPGKLTVKRIVYMAPACSVIDAADALVPFLRASGATQFHLLALHPVAEADEINLLDSVPRGSLLEWIDNFYTNPATHSERVFGKWANVVPALSLFASVRDQTNFKAFNVKGDSFPQAHGDFHSIPFWKPEAYEVDGVGSFDEDWLAETCERWVETAKALGETTQPW